MTQLPTPLPPLSARAGQDSGGHPHLAPELLGTIEELRIGIRKGESFR